MWPAEHNKSTITVFEEDNVDGMFLLAVIDRYREGKYTLYWILIIASSRAKYHKQIWVVIGDGGAGFIDCEI